jgi:DNA repair photolyase
MSTPLRERLRFVRVEAAFDGRLFGQLQRMCGGMPMRAIYEPKGAALEYAPLALNLFRGCPNGCLYCYAPACLRMTREKFHAYAVPRLSIAQVEKDAAELERAGDYRRILLSFTCDPFPAIATNEIHEYTHGILAALQKHSRPISVLTKSGKMAFDAGILPEYMARLAVMDCEFGVSLVWDDEGKRFEWEPEAAPIEERVDSLIEAKRTYQMRTWASVEPVIEPREALKAIDRLMPFADVIKIGRWNHDARANEIDWRKFVADAKALLGNHPHVFKRGLAELVD